MALAYQKKMWAFYESHPKTRILVITLASPIIPIGWTLLVLPGVIWKEGLKYIYSSFKEEVIETFATGYKQAFDDLKGSK